MKISAEQLNGYQEKIIGFCIEQGLYLTTAEGVVILGSLFLANCVSSGVDPIEVLYNILNNNPTMRESDGKKES